MTIRNYDTPAIVYDENVLRGTVNRLLRLTRDGGCKLLYSPKACAVSSVMKTLGEMVIGFSCSSLNECKRARAHLGPKGEVHLVTPAIKDRDVRKIAEVCDYVVLNSLAQHARLTGVLSLSCQVGLRVNPQLSFAKDSRYDPCRSDSKLGVPVNSLIQNIEDHAFELDGLSGIHVHNNCEGTDACDIAETTRKLIRGIPGILEKIAWINLGGGYFYDEFENPELFVQTVSELKERFSLDVYIEPGAAIVRQAGSIISSIVDLFEGEDRTIAVLDTSVNHMPEVLEYQYTPDVVGHSEGALHEYVLAGCTCLAGDQFGISCFDAPLSLGNEIVFPNAGAYTISRANTFNGVPLPDVYLRTTDGELLSKVVFRRLNQAAT